MSDARLPTCAVVIRCYNEERHIGRLLHGIMAQTVRDIDIVVVDSGSTDKTLEIARGFPVRIVHIAPEQFSFGRSLNYGFDAASGEVVVAVSAHCFPLYSDWLERLLAPFADPRVAVSYGRQQGGESTSFAEHRVFATWFPPASDANQGHPFCNNANAAVRRSVWSKLRFDETLTGLEDLAFAKAAVAEGHRVAYVAEAAVVHLHDETWRQVYNRYQREGLAFRRIFPEERFTLWNAIHLCAANLVADLRWAWRDGRLAGDAGDILLYRLMQFAGTYRGRTRDGGVSTDLKRRFYYPNHDVRHDPPASRDGLVDYGKSEPGLPG